MTLNCPVMTPPTTPTRDTQLSYYDSSHYPDSWHSTVLLWLLPLPRLLRCFTSAPSLAVCHPLKVTVTPLRTASSKLYRPLHHHQDHQPLSCSTQPLTSPMPHPSHVPRFLDKILHCLPTHPSCQTPTSSPWPQCLPFTTCSRSVPRVGVGNSSYHGKVTTTKRTCECPSSTY